MDAAVTPGVADTGEPVGCLAPVAQSVRAADS